MSDPTANPARPGRADVLLAAALTVAAELEVLLGPASDGDRLVSALIVPLTTVPLAWRRSAPLAPLAAIAAAFLIQAPLDGYLVGHVVTPVLALFIALYAAGRRLDGGRGLAWAAVAVVVTAATRVAFDPAAQRPADAVLTLVAVASPLLVGRWVRGQVLLQRELAAKAERLERERERAARHAADEERARIAADLQVAVADGLRAIVRRAQRLPGVLARDERAEARALLASVAATAREALADVRRVLGVLRREGQTAPLAPPATVVDPPAPAAPAGGEERAAAPPRVRRPPSIDARAADRLLAAAVLLGLEIELAATDPSLLAALSAAAIAVPLLWRRRHPVAVGAAVLAAVALQSTLVEPAAFPVLDIVAIVCACYAIGAHAGARAAIAGLAVTAAAATIHAAVFYPDGVVPALLGGVIVPWTVGRVARNHRRLTREIRAKTAAIERARARDAAAAATDERMRVARELHDAVAHNISVIAIQAGAADGLVERDPGRALECVALIEDVGRDAIAELARLGEPGSAPPPSLARVDVLADRARDAGLPVELRVDGERAALPAGIDLAAYRIVQEALANAAKHAAPTRAWIVVRYEPRAVEVEVGDDGRGPNVAGPRAGGGHGLVGMRERVALYGGTLDLGRGPAGGFTVHARLPLGGA